MYTIEITNENMVNVATLYLQYPFEKVKLIEEVKMNVDLHVLLDETKSWNKYLKLN